jgi:glycosyltransferase involved in cell wall biosynthesis
LEIIFYSGLGLLAYTYLGYPLVVYLVSRIKPFRPEAEPDAGPSSVTMVVAAYNEEEVIEAKVRNCLEQLKDFPAREILVASDCSGDATDRIVSSFGPPVRLLRPERRSGKSGLLNLMLREAAGSVVVFSDANTLFQAGAVSRLLAGFGDPRVGAVCGRLVLRNVSEWTLSAGEKVYWDFESRVKAWEGKRGCVLGANGGIYAILRELYSPIPADREIMDDFFVIIKILEKSRPVLYAGNAVGTEYTSSDRFGEFRRKIRIGKANFNLLPSLAPDLWPGKGWLAFSLWSHKIIRWFAPLLLLAVLASNAGLMASSLYFRVLMTGQLLFYGMGLAGIFASAETKSIWLVPTYFLTMNAALLAGLGQSLFGRKKPFWDRVERSG